jgi:fatty-acyl-CoA synthase
LNERINRLANGLTRLGVKPGDVVAAVEFDSHRYLECFSPCLQHGGHAPNGELAAFS